MALPESLPSSKYSNPLQPSLPRRGLDCAAGLFIEKALKFQGNAKMNTDPIPNANTVATNDERSQPAFHAFEDGGEIKRR
jgi:hypothetical protein